MSSLPWRRVGCFKMCIIKMLLDILNRFTKKCNILYSDYDKNQKKKARERLDALKVLANKDYIMKNVSSKTKQSSYFVRAIFATVIMALLFLINPFLDGSSSVFLGICSIFILSSSLFYTYNTFVILLLSFSRYLRQILFSVLISTNTIILGDIIIGSISSSNNPNRILGFFENLFNEHVLNDNIWSFWIIFILLLASSCLSLLLVLKTQDIFELELMGIENRLILGVLAIVTFIVGVDIDKVRPIGIVLLVLVIQTAFFEFRQSQLLSKMYEKAQEIFQEQLLLEKPRYEELKKCYYYGGEKYKEKLLSTEKFLEVIVKNELKSLKDLKTYDDYKLYKTYKGRSYL